MTAVAVMMSVYNGEKFIAEQIESILAQQGVNLDIHIRNDGSDIEARSILQRFAENYPNIYVTHGENLGIKDSFLKLIADVPAHYDYYAFSDADDVWLPEKLKSAVDVLGREDQTRGHAYCSQITLVDENLEFIGYGRALNRPISFENAIVECRMSGATAVFNRKLIKIAKSLDYSQAVMHDAWMNLVSTGFGKVYFDPASYILYRQHGRNADGGKRSAVRVWKDRMGRAELFSRYARQAEAFLTQMPEKLSGERVAILDRLIRYERGQMSPIKFLFDPDIKYQRNLSKFLTFAFLLRAGK